MLDCGKCDEERHRAIAICHELARKWRDNAIMLPHMHKEYNSIADALDVAADEIMHPVLTMRQL